MDFVEQLKKLSQLAANQVGFSRYYLESALLALDGSNVHEFTEHWANLCQQTGELALAELLRSELSELYVNVWRYKQQAAYGKAITNINRSPYADMPVVNALAGMCYLSANNLPQAEGLLKRAVDSQPNNPIILNQCARVMLRKQDINGAEHFLARSMAIEPDNADSKLIACAITAQTDADLALIQISKLIEQGVSLHEAKLFRARLYFAKGLYELAEKELMELLLVRPGSVEVIAFYMDVAAKQNKLSEQLVLCDLWLATDPGNAQIIIKKAGLLHRQGQLPAAISLLEDATKNFADNPQIWSTLGLMYHYANQLTSAISAYQQTIALNPKHYDAYNNLGCAYKDVNRLDEAIKALEKAIELKPDFYEAFSNLGAVYSRQNQFSKAIDFYDRALAIKPDFAIALFGKGSCYRGLDKLDLAVSFIEKAIAIDPNLPEAYAGLGMLYYHIRHLDKAEALVRRAIELRPNFSNAIADMATILLKKEQPEQALGFIKRAISLNPNNAYYWNNLGSVQRQLGDGKGAIESFKKSIAIEPDDAAVYSNLLFTMSHDDTLSDEELIQAHIEFGKHFESSITPFNHDKHSKDPEKVLRLGFVSADLRQHAVANFVMHIFEQLDKCKFQLIVYNNHHIKDQISDRIAGYCLEWHDIYTMEDNEVARKIVDDKIDILIDLSGHTAGNRLTTFMYKPAPVQVSMIGYPLTTGMKRMDYYLADRYLTPKGESEQFFSEQLMCADKLLMFDFLFNSTPVNDLPALTKGYLTFGTFNRPNKINLTSVAWWSSVLHALPTSKMLLGGMTGDGASSRILAMFEQYGIKEDRLVFVRKTDLINYQKLHHHVDVILDTYPYGGGTTSWHALWMGVPVLSKYGNLIPSRVGYALMSYLGYDDWASRDEHDLIQKIVAVSQDLPSLNQLRHGLRQKIIDLKAGGQCAADIGKLFVMAWQRYCHGLPATRLDV